MNFVLKLYSMYVQTMRVRLQPPSGSDLPAFNPLLPPAAITQVLLLANPHKVNKLTESENIMQKLGCNSTYILDAEIGLSVCTQNDTFWSTLCCCLNVAPYVVNSLGQEIKCPNSQIYWKKRIENN